MKRALHFATKRNSQDIKKCNCFWVASYDLFASARKAVHGKGPRNYNVQPRRVGWGVGETQFDPKSSTVLSEPKHGPPPPHPPLKIPGSAPGLSSLETRLLSLKQYCELLQGLSKFMT